MFYYDNIPAIERVFSEFGNPVWILNSGKGKSTYPANDSNRLYSQKNPDLHISESWDMLFRQLELVRHRGGYGHVYVGQKDNFINIPIWFPHASGNGGESSGGGIGVAGMPAMPYSFNDFVNKERELWELRRSVEEMQESRVGGFWDRVGESLLSSEQLPALVNGLVSLIAKVGSGGVAFPGVANTPPAIPQSMPDQQPNQQQSSDFRSRIQRHFRSREEMENYLQKVADIFEADPEGMKSLLDQSTRLR